MPSEEQWYTPTGLANAMMAKIYTRDHREQLIQACHLDHRREYREALLRGHLAELKEARKNLNREIESIKHDIDALDGGRR